MLGRCGKKEGRVRREERSPGTWWRVKVVPPGEVALAERRPRSPSAGWRV